MAISIVPKTIAPAELGGETYETAEPEEELAPVKPATSEDLTLEQLQYLLEQKRLKIARDAKEAAIKIEPPMKAQQGMAWVFNRTADVFLWQYDGLVYGIDGHDMILLPERIAKHGRKRSLVSLDPVANTAVYKLALEGEPKFGVPLKVVNRLELIDRTSDNNPLGAALSGSTRVVALKVDGAAESLARRANQYVELE